MAGTLSADYIQPQSNTGLTILTPAGGTIASVNIGGIYSATGNLLISSSFNGLVANTGISGLITDSQIASVANTKITGTINSNQLGSNVAQFNGMKNRIINGAMVIDQRNAGASVSSGFTVDRWNTSFSVASKYTAQQNAGSVTPPVGFTNYLGITSSSAYTVGASENFAIQQPIEGYNIADLGWGTANAKTITLSFQIRSSLTGTFGGAILNSAQNRSYPFSYTISSANTWTSISVTIAGDTSGTWLTTNGVGMYVFFGLGVGSTYSGTAGAWAGTTYYSSTGATSVVGTNGATFYITGVQLEVGSSATGFEYRQYGQELQLCQRYYQVLAKGTSTSLIGSSSYFSSTRADGVMFFPCSMRGTPTFSIVSGAGYYRCYLAGSSNSVPMIYINGYTATYSGVYFYNNTDFSGLSNGAGWWETANANAFLAVSAEL